MAYDKELSSRFRDCLIGIEGISEKKMMGGVCFLINGNMIGGASRTKEGIRRFMFRVGKDNESEALARKGASIMSHGNRKMSGFIYVGEQDCNNEDMTSWVSLALSFAGSLPHK